MDKLFSLGLLLSAIVVTNTHAGVIGPVDTWSNWAGAYVGGALGGNWTGFSSPIIVGPTTLGSITVGPYNQSYKVSPGSFIGGGQLGYNWQLERIVMGLEFTLDGQKLESSRQLEQTSSPFVAGDEFIAKNNLQSSLLAHLGYTRGKWLYYVAGGISLAYVQFSANFISSVNSIGTVFPAAFATQSQTLYGGTGGIGAEYAMTPQWSFGVAGVFTSYMAKQYILGNLPAFSLSSGQFLLMPTVAKLNMNTSELLFKVNYHFDTKY